jgi:hypothetical protein
MSHLNECPSCGGKSLSLTGDEGALVCDDCDEQFHGFRQEEMDDDDAAHLAVFTRQSQEAKAQAKRLNTAAADARAAVRAASASADASRDRISSVYAGVVVISRAVVDALIASGHVPGAIIDPTFSIVAHWVRMCHAGGVLANGIVGATAKDFSLPCILSLISLAAIYVRSPLLPRDLCSLANRGKIPFLTAAADLLDSAYVEDPVLRALFAPRTMCSVEEVTAIASAVATSDYAWPPIRRFFDGPRVIYRRRVYLAFPLGHHDATLLRVVRVLGLPDDFCDRVQRFRELRQISVAMSLETHASLAKLRLLRLQASKERNAQAAASFETGYEPFVPKKQPCNVVDSNGTPHSEPSQSQPSQSQPSQSVFAQGDDESEDVENRGETEGDDDCDDGGKSRGNAAGYDALNSYPFPPGLSEYPFSKKVRNDCTLNEFPTDRSLLVDLVNTMRICYGHPDVFLPTSSSVARCVDVVDIDETRREKTKRVAEWQDCVSSIQSWLCNGGSSDANTLQWAGLSPTALASLRGKPLRSYVDMAMATTSGALPLFMNEHAEAMQKLGMSDSHNTVVDDLLEKGVPRLHTDIKNDMLECVDEALASSAPSDDHLHRIGTWVWNGTFPTSDGCVSTIGPDVMVDSLPGVKRRVLSKLRGFHSIEMQLQNVSRALRRYAQTGEEVLWSEPAAIGRAMYVAQRFLQGTPAYASGHVGEDLLRSHEFALCCNLTLATVLNYVDVYLGEEGMMNNNVEDKDLRNRMVRSQRMNTCAHYRHDVHLTKEDIAGVYHLKKRRTDENKRANRRKAKKPD